MGSVGEGDILLPCTDVYYLFERQCHRYKILYVEVRTSTITTSNPRLNRLASSSIRLQYFDKWPACLPTFLGISQEKRPHPRGSLLQISKVGTSRDLVDLVEVWVTISRIRGVIYLNLFSWSVQFSWHSIDTKSHFSFLRLLLCLIKYNFKFYSGL